MADLPAETIAEGRTCIEPSPIPMCIGIEAATHASGYRDTSRKRPSPLSLAFDRDLGHNGTDPEAWDVL